MSHSCKLTGFLAGVSVQFKAKSTTDKGIARNLSSIWKATKVVSSEFKPMENEVAVNEK